MFSSIPRVSRDREPTFSRFLLGLGTHPRGRWWSATPFARPHDLNGTDDRSERAHVHLDERSRRRCVENTSYLAVTRNHDRMMDQVNTARVRRVQDRLWFLRSALNDLECRMIRAGLREGRLVRVVRGCFVDQAVWAAWFPEERLLARTVGVAVLNAQYEPLFSHHSAAVLWGLPLFRLDNLRVHVLTPTRSSGRSSQTVLRHIGDWHDSEACSIAGIRTTSMTRTLVDLARAATPEMALAAVDAGLIR